jgi:hypothetical protein
MYQYILYILLMLNHSIIAGTFLIQDIAVIIGWHAWLTSYKDERIASVTTVTELP